MIRQTLFATLAAAAVMFPLDFLWLRTMRPFYESQMGSILLAEPRIAAAVLFYTIYAAGVAFFAIQPNLAAGRSGPPPPTAPLSASSPTAPTTRQTMPP